ncbi:MAG: prolipoprotein diacylglyceryl transferase [Clostridia bacterium]|nr:prolipoprotein diacylglyceryl transferase [Clostridia bacterium]
MVAPLCALGFGISHIGCVFEGCCHGYAYEGPFAIYNPVLNYNVFPTPILESLLAILAFVGLMIYMGKKKWKTNGQMYPIMLILFSGRFFLEFLRDNEKIWLGCSSLSFHALFAGVVGIVWLIVLNKINKRKKVSSTSTSTEENFYKKIEISKEEYNKLKNKEIALLIVLMIISLAITFGFIYWLVSRFVLHSVLFEKIMVSLLTLSALSLFGFLTYKIIAFFDNINKIYEKETKYLFFISWRKVLMVEENKYYMFKTDRKLTLKTYNNELEESEAK